MKEQWNFISHLQMMVSLNNFINLIRQKLRRKRAKNSPKIVFFGFFANSKMKNHMTSNIFGHTLYLVKLKSFNYGLKCSWPIKLQDSLKV